MKEQSHFEYHGPLTRQPLRRRTLLKGLGATLTIPWMPSLAWSQGGRAAELAGPPKRWASCIFANGVHTGHWWAKGEGAAMELGETLQPLDPFKRDLLLIENMRLMDKPDGIHGPMYTNLLSGQKVARGGEIRVHESLDQHLARTIGRDTPIPSLVLGCEPLQHGLRAGVSAVYFCTISWSSESTPVAPEIYPRQAFDRLFDSSGMLKDRSVLDSVLQQSKDLRGRLGRADQTKLDEYMASVREVEQRIDKSLSNERPAGWRPSLSEPDMARPESGIPATVREHFELMQDIIVLGFRMDKTRVATFLYENDGTYDMAFGFLGKEVGGQSLHVISHHGNDAAKKRAYQHINRFHSEMFAQMLGRMAAVDEGNGSLLDNTILLYGSSMGDGSTHDGNHLPIVLAGGRNCGIRGGRAITVPEEAVADRRLSNLHLACARRLGLPLSRWGNSTRPFDEIG